MKVLFFDFDGTISDALKLGQDSLIETFDNYGLKFNKTKAKKLLGAKMPTILKKLGVILPMITQVRKSFWKKMMKGVKDNKIKLCVSVKPLYELKKQGYKLIIITNGKSRFTKASIKALKIKNLFNKVYGSEHFSTKDQLLEKLFKKYNIKPHESAYIGDRFSDIKYARKAGCFAIAIHNKCSFSTLKEIQEQKPDFIIKDFKGLKKVVEKLKQD